MCGTGAAACVHIVTLGGGSYMSTNAYIKVSIKKTIYNHQLHVPTANDCILYILGLSNVKSQLVTCVLI